MAKGDEQTNEDENTCNKTHSFFIPKSGNMLSKHHCLAEILVLCWTWSRI
jgi:hypothetical protein